MDYENMNRRMRFVEVKGSPYKRGLKAGRMFRETLPAESAAYAPLLEDSGLAAQVQRVKNKVDTVFPEYLQEVWGRADGAGVSREVYFLMMCPEILGQGTGCTSILYRRPDGSILLGHNEDDVFTVSNSCMTKCVTDSGWFVTSDFHTMPFGNGFSWNQHGIIKTINYCHPVGMNKEGIPRYFAQRHISEAHSIEDFVERCDMPDRASGYHALVVDTGLNKALSVEVTHEAVSVQDIDEWYVHTNHYIHLSISRGNDCASQGSTSVFRLHKARAMLQEKLDLEQGTLTRDDLLEVLTYRGSAYEDSIQAVTGDPHWTFATLLIQTGQAEKAVIHFHITKEIHTLNMR